MLLTPRPQLADFNLDMFQVEVAMPSLSKAGQLELKVEVTSPVSPITYGAFIAAHEEGIADSTEFAAELNKLAIQISQIIQGERTYAYLILGWEIYVFTPQGKDSDKAFLAEVKKNGWYAPDIIFDARVVSKDVQSVRIQDEVFGILVDKQIDTTIGFPTTDPTNRLVITYLGMVTDMGFVPDKAIPNYMLYNPGQPLIDTLRTRVSNVRNRVVKANRYNPSSRKRIKLR